MAAVIEEEGREEAEEDEGVEEGVGEDALEDEEEEEEEEEEPSTSEAEKMSFSCASALVRCHIEEKHGEKEKNRLRNRKKR